MSEDTLFEISRQSLLINKYEETTLSWHNSILTVRTDKGIYFFQFSCNLECLDKKIDCIQTHIATPQSSPATLLFTNQLFKPDMSNMEYTEMLINPAMWPHNPQITQDLTSVSAYEWSPAGFNGNNKCTLAILNNIGHVELYTQKQYQWTSLLNLSEYSKMLLDQPNRPQGFIEVKNAAYTVETCAICWAPKLNTNNSCYIVAAQKSGVILFWYLQCNGTDVKVKLQGKIANDSFEICSLAWIPKSNEQFLLICSNITGQILAYDCVIQNDEVRLIQSHTLWPDKDRMIAKYLKYTKHEDNLILICNKHRHLLILMVNDKCEVVSRYLKNINDHRLTAIVNIVDGFYVSTVNCKLYKGSIKRSEKGKELDVSLNLIDSKESHSSWELYSFCFSANNVICALGIVDKKTSCRKKKITKLDVIFATTERNMESLILMILNNPTKKLTNFWDCIELLRYKTMKLKLMPAMDYHELYADAGTDVYKLKVYLILVKLYNVLINIVKITTEPLLPETCIEFIKEMILFNHGCKLIKDLLEAYQTNGDFNVFETECCYGAKRFLEYYCKKHKKDISEFLDAHFVNELKSSPYICQCCDDEIDGFSCKSGHLNMFCYLTFTQIQNDDYLVCKNCGTTARAELYTEKPLCLFCDLYLCKSLNT